MCGHVPHAQEGLSPGRVRAACRPHVTVRMPLCHALRDARHTSAVHTGAGVNLVLQDPEWFSEGK